MVIGLCLVRSVTLASQAPGSGPPRLVIQGADIELGQMDAGATRTLTVTLSNGGGAPLAIETVRTAVVCLTPRLPSTTLAPGASATLSLALTATCLDDEFDVSVVIVTNDPSARLAKVRLRGSLFHAVRMAPVAVFVGPQLRSVLESVSTPVVTLTAQDKTPLGEVLVAPSVPGIRAVVTCPTDRQCEIRTTLTPALPIGQLRETVRITTQHPRAPVLSLSVGGTVVGDIDSIGPAIDFGIVGEGRAATARRQVDTFGGRPVKVLRTEVDLPVPAQVTATPNDKGVAVELRIDKAPPLTVLSGRVTLHLDWPEEPVLRIPVAGFVVADRPFELAAQPAGEARFLQVLQQALLREDAIPDERFFADVLGGVRDDRAVKVLLRALKEPTVNGQMRAIELLSVLKTPEAVAALQRAAAVEPHEFVRKHAMGYYAKAAGAEAVPTLLAGLQDDDPWVREEAAAALGMFGDASVLPALRAVINDPNLDTREAVRNAIDAIKAR